MVRVTSRFPTVGQHGYQQTVNTGDGKECFLCCFCLHRVDSLRVLYVLCKCVDTQRASICGLKQAVNGARL